MTYANVMATIAVFGVLAGSGAYAASQIGPEDIAKNAIRAKHIKKKQVRSKHLKRNSVLSQHVEDGSLQATDFDAAQLPVGPRGPQGPRGLQGEPGAPGPDAMWAAVNSDDEIVDQSGGISVQTTSAFNGVRLRFPESVQGKAIVATAMTSALGSPDGSTDVKVAPCGPGAFAAVFCDSPTDIDGNNPRDALAIAFDDTGAVVHVGFYIAVLP